MSKVTELAAGQITTLETVTIELVEANETPAVVIIRWPAKTLVSWLVGSVDAEKERAEDLHATVRRLEAKVDRLATEQKHDLDPTRRR